MKLGHGTNWEGYARRVTDTLVWLVVFGAKERKEESGGHGRIERDLERSRGCLRPGIAGPG